MGILRRTERACWWVLIRIPLVLVYSLTTWAVWVASGLCLKWRETSSRGTFFLVLVDVLYILLNWSYTACAFTDPGSPLNGPSSSTNSKSSEYTELPLHETSITVKSTGGTRFCKKCQTHKPDRAHHCSTCRRCVLKMDHHCPWIATCVGFRNYKAFVLFCTYVTLFCWTCEAVAGSYMWQEFNDFQPGRSMLGVNMILLSVLAGIFGLVMTGFTSWHYHLALKNQTTIERLEKTRYMGTLRGRFDHNSSNGQARSELGESEGLMHKYGEQLREMHANAIPGVTRVEEGEERSSLYNEPGDIEAQQYPHLSRQYPSANQSPIGAPSTERDYAEMEHERERERYESYLDEKDSETLPNAFDLGWKRNLTTIFGSNALLWLFPILTSVGDGFRWTPNPAWVRAREEARQRREVQWKEQEARERRAGWGAGAKYPVLNSKRLEVDEDEHLNDGGGYLVTNAGIASVPQRGRRSPMKADRLLGRVGMYADGVPLERMGKGRRREPGNEEDTASVDGLYSGGESEGSGDEEESGGMGKKKKG